MEILLLEQVSLDKKFEDSLQALQEEFEKSWEQYWEAFIKHKNRKAKKSTIFFKRDESNHLSRNSLPDDIFIERSYF